MYFLEALENIIVDQFSLKLLFTTLDPIGTWIVKTCWDAPLNSVPFIQTKPNQILFEEIQS